MNDSEEENEFSLKFKELYEKMLEKEKEYNEHLKNCELKHHKVNKFIKKEDSSDENTI